MKFLLLPLKAECDRTIAVGWVGNDQNQSYSYATVVSEECTEEPMFEDVNWNLENECLVGVIFAKANRRDWSDCMNHLG